MWKNAGARIDPRGDKKSASKKKRLESKKVLITAGPTYESIDPVRFIGNHSSGKMGFSLAKAACDLGAEVTVIAGPTNQYVDGDIKRIDVVSAEEMYQRTIEEFPNADICIMAAAVADYRPKMIASQKIKKQEGEMKIVLEKTKDILSELGKEKKAQILIGFALETENELNNAKDKLKRKNLDAIILNSLRDKQSGFGYDTNKISIINRNNIIKEFPLKSKNEIAYDIFSYICNDLNID